LHGSERGYSSLASRSPAQHYLKPISRRCHQDSSPAENGDLGADPVANGSNST
jgi:hypothetical protein